MKGKPIISVESKIRRRNENIFYESAEAQPEKENIVSNRDSVSEQSTLQESESKFVMVCDDEFFDAEEAASWKRGEDPELLSSDEVEGSAMEEEEPEPRNHVRFASHN